jgi:hypothetical protein
MEIVRMRQIMALVGLDSTQVIHHQTDINPFMKRSSLKTLEL